MIRESTNKEKVTDYIDAVLSGDLVVGKLERAAVERHVSDLKTANQRGYRFDEKRAERVCNFFPLIMHTTGEYNGQPFYLKPFQRFIVWCLFGWVKVSNGMRRFKYAFISLARGNGKSPFAAVLLLFCFAFDYPLEARAECYTAATKKKQSKIVFDEVKRFVDRNPQMKRWIRCLSNRLVIPQNDSTIEPLGQDSENTDGLIPHFISVDELHAWRERHRDLWDKLQTALGKRQQPLCLIITTAGDDESELWEEIYDMVVQIVDRDSPYDADDWFVFICEIDEEDDPFDESCWPKANPLMNEGVVKVDHLRSMAQTARIRPDARSRFVRYHCNKKVTSASKLIPPKLWAKGKGPIDLDDMAGRECYGGFDWGWKDDLAALALIFPLDVAEITSFDEETEQEFVELKRRYACLVDAWVPEGCPRDLTMEPWRTWIDEGWLRVTRGNTTDTAAIYARLGQHSRDYAIKSIAMDPNNCRELGSRVEPEFGIEPFWFGQTHGKYNEPTRELLDALEQDRFRHGDNPLLAWCANNVIASQDTREYIKPEKKRSKDKIDPICAVIMGLSECLFAEREGPSIYEQPGSLIL